MVSQRVRVALILVKLLLVLPTEAFNARMPPVLMDLCSILRSNSQDSRDATRKTLAEICTLTGPSAFGFVVKELRSALPMGVHLHVLSYTVHSILESTKDIFRPGDLDYCISSIVAVIMDDTFGVPGLEKEAEEYRSRRREVKSSRSFDSMELIAQNTSLSHLSELITPIRMLLLERLDDRMMQKINELLRRIGLGIMHNASAQDQQVLMFCYEVIKDVYNASSQSAGTDGPQNPKLKRYLVIMKNANKTGNRGAQSSQIGRLVRFALDVLRMVLRRHDILRTPANLKQFMPIVGDAIVSRDEDVQISAIRLLTSILDVPLVQIAKDAEVYAA
ncbi:hypothetical protein LTS18_000555, partial [Coniosporium uncinatum]